MIALIASLFAILSIWQFGRKGVWAWRFALIEMAFWWAFMLQDMDSRWGLVPINVCKTGIVVWNLLGSRRMARLRARLLDFFRGHR